MTATLPGPGIVPVVAISGTVTSERDLLDAMQRAALTRSANSWSGSWRLPGSAA